METFRGVGGSRWVALEVAPAGLGGAPPGDNRLAGDLAGSLESQGPFGDHIVGDFWSGIDAALPSAEPEVAPSASPAPPSPAPPPPAQPPAPSRAAPVKKKSSVDAALLTGPGLPEGGLYAEGTKSDILTQFAQDIEILDGGDGDVDPSHASMVIDEKIKGGAMLVFMGQGRILTVCANGLTPERAQGARTFKIPSLNALEGLVDLPGPNDLFTVADSVRGAGSIISGARLAGGPGAYQFKKK